MIAPPPEKVAVPEAVVYPDYGVMFGPFRRRKLRPTVRAIMIATCAEFDVPVEKIKSPDRHKEYLVPRQCGMYLAKIMTGRSFPYIGSIFGGKDHTTVMHSVKKIALLRQTDLQIDARLSAIQSRFLPMPDS